MRVIIATSTLSEGVNIPVNFLLIPSICRGQHPFSIQEFTNLIGRAGRPGVASEGSALVMLSEKTMERDRYGRMRPAYDRQRLGYEGLITEIEETTSATREGIPEDDASSALSHLLRAIETAWGDLTGGGSNQEFLVLPQNLWVNVRSWRSDQLPCC